MRRLPRRFGVGDGVELHRPPTTDGRGQARKAAGHHTDVDFGTKTRKELCDALMADIAIHEDFLDKAYALRATYVALGWDTKSVDKMIDGMEKDLADAKQAYNDNCILRV